MYIFFNKYNKLIESKYCCATNQGVLAPAASCLLLLLGDWGALVFTSVCRVRPPPVCHPPSLLLRIVPLRQVAAVGRSVRSVKMSATGLGGCGPGPGATSGLGSGASNPRKFSEKIALHTQRQAEETAAFQEVMMDITSTRVSECKAAAGGTALAGGREALLGLGGCPAAPGPLGAMFATVAFTEPRKATQRGQVCGTHCWHSISSVSDPSLSAASELLAAAKLTRLFTML